MGSAFSQQQYVVPKPPTGRLTLVTGEPVMSSEQANKQTIYYTPYTGAMVPIYDGTGWRERTFAELSLALAGSANWAADSNYDLFVVDDGGTLRLLTGPVWTNDTTRSTAISRLNGLWVNDASMTGRYGASSTMTVGQYRGLYVGTVRMNANGQTTWELGGSATGGDPALLYVWNCYNRVRVDVSVVDSTGSWTYSTGTWHPVNSSNSNRCSFVRGLAEDGMQSILALLVSTETAGRVASVSVALDATTALTSDSSRNDAYNSAGISQITAMALYEGTPGIGKHYFQAIENNAVGQVTFFGASYILFSTNGMF